MAYEHTLKKRIEFHETDMAGLVHFSNFFRYVESAEHDFFQSLNIPIHTTDGMNTRGWPRIAVRCEYVSPLRFEDKIKIRIAVTKKSDSTLTYRYLITKNASPVPTLSAYGSIIIAHVQLNRETGEFKTEKIPHTIDNKIEVAPVEVLTEFDAAIDAVVTKKRG